jgi:energy-coupling factor transporter ATP-binding protein EcfA2
MDYPVNNLDDAYNACNPDQPLEVGDTRYLAVRNGENVSILTKRIIRTKQNGEFHKQLFTGHIGSGKSTELKRLQQKLQDKDYFVVFLDVQQSLDLGEITYQDVLLNIAQAVTEALEK